MQTPSDPKRNSPVLDLGTLREVLAHIRDDLHRVPGLEGAARLIGEGLAEMEAAERRRLTSVPGAITNGRRPAVRRH